MKHHSLKFCLIPWFNDLDNAIRCNRTKSKMTEIQQNGEMDVNLRKYSILANGPVYK